MRATRHPGPPCGSARRVRRPRLPTTSPCGSSAGLVGESTTTRQPAAVSIVGEREIVGGRRPSTRSTMSRFSPVAVRCSSWLMYGVMPMPAATSSSGFAASFGSRKSPLDRGAGHHRARLEREQRRLEAARPLGQRGCAKLTGAPSPGAEAMLNTRRQPRASVLPWGRVSSMNCPGDELTGACGRNVELPAARRQLPLPTYEVEPDAAALPPEEGEQVADQRARTRAWS